MRACWALAAPTGGAGSSGGSRARSEPGCGAGVLGWQHKRAWAAEALGRSGSGDWAAGSERAVAGKGEGGVGRATGLGKECGRGLAEALAWARGRKRSWARRKGWVGPSAGKGEGVGLGPFVGFLGRVKGLGFLWVFPFLFLFTLSFQI